MKRPFFMATVGAALSLSTLSAFAASQTHQTVNGELQAKCLPGQPCWPTDQQWAALAKTLPQNARRDVS